MILLDSGPLGLVCSRPGVAVVDRCQAWLLSVQASHSEVIVPAIADYEVRRELIRLRAAAKLRNLADLRVICTFLPIEQRALDRAAEFWALVRLQGLPTAGPDELDADAILAGMAATIGGPGDAVTIATTNVRHLGRFPGVDAREWATVS